MKLVLLSGGSGKRLWPLSNNQRSKQFIRAFQNPKTGEMESMVQRVWNQIGAAGLQEMTYIATGEGQKNLIKKQIGIKNENIIIEPTRRDTYAALLLVGSHLNSVANVSEEEVIVVAPVDPYVETNFFREITQLEDVLHASNATLGLVGIKPTFPSEKYGYIVPDSEISGKVSRFQEKPKTAAAVKLINQGAVWNAGVFGIKIKSLLDEIRKYNLPTDYHELVKVYDRLPKNSFDFEFSEKQENIFYTVYNGSWKDLGTWNTLTEEADVSNIGSNTVQIECENTEIINEQVLPIAAIGVKDLIIVAGPEGVLVTTKQASPRIKEIPSSFFETIHYVEEIWGVRKTLYQTEKARASLYEMINGKTATFTLLDNQSIYRLSGKGTISYRGKEVSLKGIEDFIFVMVMEEN